MDTIYEAQTSHAKRYWYEGNYRTLREIALENGLSYHVLRGRLLSGRSLEESLLKDLDTKCFKGCVISAKDFKEIPAPYTPIDKKQREVVSKLRESGYTIPEIKDRTGLSISVLTHFLRSSGIKAGVKYLRGFNGEVFEFAVHSTLSQQVVDEWCHLKLLGYLDKEISNILNISTNHCSYLRTTFCWKPDYTEGRPLLCHNKSYIFVSGKDAIPFYLSQQLLALKDMGYSNRKIARLVGKSVPFVSKWLNKLKWSKT